MDLTRGFFDSDFESVSSGERVGNVARDRMLLRLEATNLAARHAAALELPEVKNLAKDLFLLLFAKREREMPQFVSHRARSSRVASYSGWTRSGPRFQTQTTSLSCSGRTTRSGAFETCSACCAREFMRAYNLLRREKGPRKYHSCKYHAAPVPAGKRS